MQVPEPSQPYNARIVDGYQTQNLNKSSYLLIHGAIYNGCHYDAETGHATFILDKVNLRKVDEFWDDTLEVEFWTFIRMRKFLKDKVKQKIDANSQK